VVCLGAGVEERTLAQVVEVGLGMGEAVDVVRERAESRVK